jgi:energy-coupling factor transporter ATP-binding protein EcfA2
MALSSARGEDCEGDMSDSSLIAIRGLTKRYGNHVVLDGIDLTIEAGETIAILGPSGSGKSTLVDGRGRLIQVPAGTIFVDGRDVTTLPLESVREPEPGPGPGQPEGEEGLEADRPGVAGRCPDRREDLDRPGAVPARALAAAPGRAAPRRGPVEAPEGVLPVVARDLAELVQNAPLEGPGGLAVPGMDRFEVFPSGLLDHDVTLLSDGSREGYILNGAMIPRVTF